MGSGQQQPQEGIEQPATDPQEMPPADTEGEENQVNNDDGTGAKPVQPDFDGPK